MKKKLMVVLAVCAMAVMVTACGSKSANTETTTAAGVTEASKESGSKGTDSKDETTKAAEKETTKAEETTVDEKEAAGPGAVTDDEKEVNLENKNYEDLENSDYEGFAKQIVDVVAKKDMNALADLMAYPSYVSCVKENDGIVNSKEEFLAQDPEVIFDQSLLDAIAKADLSDLTPLMAGVVVGDDTPNIIFNSVDGKLGITGINY